MNLRSDINYMAFWTFMTYATAFAFDLAVSVTVFRHRYSYFMAHEMAREFAVFLNGGGFPWFSFWANAIPMIILAVGWYLAKRFRSGRVMFSATIPAIGMSTLHGWGAMSWIL